VRVNFSRLFACWLGVFAGCYLAELRGDAKFIRLRNEIIATAAPTNAPAGAQKQSFEPAAAGLFLIQFRDHFDSAWREPLRLLGVQLLRFVPDDAFVAQLDGARLSQIKAQPFVRWIGPYRADHKVHPALNGIPAVMPGAELPSVSVLLSTAASPRDLATVRQSLQKVERQSGSRFGAVLQGKVTPHQLRMLALSPSVLWIEPAPRFRLFDEVSSKIVGGIGDIDQHPTLTQQLGYDGRGVAVAVADSGLNNGDALSMHPDLAGRVDAFLFYGRLTDAADEHSHGTHVSGIIAGNGATGETDENGALYGLGVASGAHIVVQRIFDGAGGFEPPPTFETLTRDAVRAGAVIGSNSWGDDTQGRYDLSAAEFDALVRDADALALGDQPYILEFSAGNAGPGPQTIGSPAVAKNVIATGASQNDRLDFFIYADGPEAMADFSSRGPCEDGRIKPDLVAPGTWIASLQSESATDENSWAPISPNYQYQGGTSQAGPHASGAAAVFVQFYRQTRTNAIPSPALVKAALINSAHDLDNDIETDPTPNMDEGWGRIDLPELIDSNRAYEFLDQTSTLATGETYERRVVVASRELPLKITMAYSDVPGFPGAIPALVNNLDLEVIGPDGSVYHGNQFEAGESVANVAAFDTVNNVEAVHLNQPAPGEYLLRIRARNVAEDARRDTGPVDQDFALVISGGLPFPGEGIVILDRAAYTVPSQIGVKLIDTDLAGQASAPVTLKSTSEPAGELLVLRASGNDGVFTGVVATALGPATTDGRLQIKHGDLIEAVYQDASPADTRTATAAADLVAPLITGVSATNRFGTIVISWQTDEAANAIVRYGTNSSLTLSATNASLGQEHEVILENLVAGTNYFFAVASMDLAGNTATNDNSGSLYRFVPVPAATVLLVNAYVPDDPAFSSQEIPLTSYTDALNQTGVSYEIWDVSERRRSPNTNELRPFRIVIWRINDSLFGNSSLTAPEQTALQTYLNGGGALFLSSMEILSRLGNVPFRTNVLHVQAFAEDAGVPSIKGLDNDVIANGLQMDLDYSDYDNDILQFLDQSPDVSDTLTPTSDAVPIIFDDASGKAAGLRYPRTGQDSTGRVVFLSFPLDTTPETTSAPNNRAGLLGRILSFLAPGINGISTIALDNTQYTIPSLVTVEVADSDLAGQQQTTVKFFSNTATNGQTVALSETVRPGLFRGFITLVARTNAPAPGQLLVKQGDLVQAEYFDASRPSILRAFATVDTGAPSITNILVVPEYQEATISWETSEPTDALVQFGESSFLGRTAYNFESTGSHEVVLKGLSSDRLYYYQVVSRDTAGNTTIDDNRGKLYTFNTLKPITPPWSDDLEKNSQTNWSVLDGDETQTTWTWGVPNSASGVTAHSGTNVWASNLDGDSIDTADTLLVSPAIDLAGGNLAVLHFWHNYDFSERGEFDIYEFGQVYVSTNNSADWTLVAEFTDVSADWEEADIDLSPFLGRVVRIGWYYGLFSFDSVARPGWLVDDISVTVTNIVPGTILVTNNLAQPTFALSGPISRLGQGTSLSITNAPAGQYVVTFGDVPYYQTPPPQTNTLATGGSIAFSGIYTFADTNRNGISDAWEQQFFGNVSGVHPPATDTDRDGFSDYAEFTAGTDPTNSTSRLAFSLPTQTTGGALRLTWPSVAGHAYRVDLSTNAIDWTPLSDWIRATSASTSFTTPPLTNSVPYLFRLGVRP
jgi:subtilisin family serine protease